MVSRIVRFHYAAPMSDPSIPMNQFRPYLVRALLSWILDHQMTPCVVVDTRQEGVLGPVHILGREDMEFYLSDRYCCHLQVKDSHIEFDTQFQGDDTNHTIWLPMAALVAIYPKEVGGGFALPKEEGAPVPLPPTPQEIKEEAARRRAHLRVVK